MFVSTAYRIAHSYEILRDLRPIKTPIMSKMWFEHNGVPVHFSLNVWNFLDATFLGRRIDRGGSIAWPPRSLDLSCLEFFLWDRIKS